ncbi:F-box/LRR-repeat protein 13 [Linum perenne]
MQNNISKKKLNIAARSRRQIQGAMKNSSSKPQSQKAAKRHKKGDSIDRLSYLPDSVLWHILSFLDTKSAVQTSVLSRQWRCIWKYVPIINIDSDSFKISGNYESFYEIFKRFVDKVLSLRYPLNLRKVIFVDDSWDEERDEDLFARFIKHALSHHTQHLSIDLQNNGNWAEMQYPFSDMFGSITDCNVKTLELSAISLDIGWKSSSFQVLTKLELSRCMILLNDEDVVDPFSRFPCLKHLVMRHIDPSEDNDHKAFMISGLQLLSLDLEYIFFERIGIYAPKLKSFTLDDQNGRLEFSELTLSSLEYADVCVDFEYNYMEEDCQYMTSLFNGLNNATSLMLRSSTVEELMIMSEFLENQPSPFTRLKLLTLEASHAPFAVINYILKGSSNMKPVVKFKLADS